MIAVPKNRGCGELNAHKGIRGVTVPFAGRMNNTKTILLQRSVREHVAGQMRCFFFYRDSLMTVCKVALANLAMWIRDQYFPASYAHATWRRLAPFFQLAGTVVPAISTVQVELRPFNDRALNRDLAVLCERVNQASLRLPDGRLLAFTISHSRCILPAQEYRVT